MSSFTLQEAARIMMATICLKTMETPAMMVMSGTTMMAAKRAASQVGARCSFLASRQRSDAAAID